MQKKIGELFIDKNYEKAFDYMKKIHSVNLYKYVFKFSSLCRKHDVKIKPENEYLLVDEIDSIEYYHTSDVCPECGGKLIPVVYGFPMEETLKAQERGEIILGGCDISGTDDFKCNKCGKSFHFNEFGLHFKNFGHHTILNLF